MPELPEVETVRRMIEPALLGRKIVRVRFFRGNLRYAIPKEKIRDVAGSGAVREVGRLGKYLMVRFPGGDWVVHLGMSGNFHRRKPKSRHVHFAIETTGGKLFFEDPRRFGFFDAVVRGEPNRHLLGKGRDGLRDCPGGDEIFRMSRGRKTDVKAFLTDQRNFSGIGNIYACEILFLCGLNPRRRAGRLTAENCAALSYAIPLVFREAVKNCGTTFDSFRTPEGRSGGHYRSLTVYEREGLPCVGCGAPIRRIAQGNRSTYYCPSCQRV